MSLSLCKVYPFCQFPALAQVLDQTDGETCWTQTALGWQEAPRSSPNSSWANWRGTQREICLRHCKIMVVMDMNLLFQTHNGAQWCLNFFMFWGNRSEPGFSRLNGTVVPTGSGAPEPAEVQYHQQRVATPTKQVSTASTFSWRLIFPLSLCHSLCAVSCFFSFALLMFASVASYNQYHHQYHGPQ